MREILFRGKTHDGNWIYGTGWTEFLNMFPDRTGNLMDAHVNGVHSLLNTMNLRQSLEFRCGGHMKIMTELIGLK